MKFEWDENKASKNISNHKVSFEEAITVFNDQLYIDFFDPDHSGNEDRYIRVGQSNKDRILIVSYTERTNVIRVISAREATKRERQDYENG